MSSQAVAQVLTCGELEAGSLEALLERYDLEVCRVEEGAPIPGSFWGPPEAGLLGRTLYVRHDTPAHSALHEACHYICMDEQRRAVLDTDAGGDDLEECAVCCLQLLLAPFLPKVSRERQMADMDAWGYSFRLGSTRAWFEDDAADARQWLLHYGLIDEESRPTFRLRA